MCRKTCTQWMSQQLQMCGGHVGAEIIPQNSSSKTKRDPRASRDCVAVYFLQSACQLAWCVSIHNCQQKRLCHHDGSCLLLWYTATDIFSFSQVWKLCGGAAALSHQANGWCNRKMGLSPCSGQCRAPYHGDTGQGAKCPQTSSPAVGPFPVPEGSFA